VPSDVTCSTRERAREQMQRASENYFRRRMDDSVRAEEAADVRDSGLPAPWRLAKDSDPPLSYLDVATAREVTQYPTYHFTRGADSLTDLRMC
jgi:hypothetical protein